MRRLESVAQLANACYPSPPHFLIIYFYSFASPRNSQWLKLGPILSNYEKWAVSKEEKLPVGIIIPPPS